MVTTTINENKLGYSSDQVETIVTLSNDKSFITLTFGGTDGAQVDYIKLDTLKNIISRLSE